MLAVRTSTSLSEAHGLIVVGLFLLAGFTAHVLGRRVHIPRVTLLLLLGFLASPSIFNLVPAEVSGWFPLTARLALSIIGFQLGERFFGKRLRGTGKTILVVSLTEVIIVTVIVFLALLLFNFPLELAILLAAVAPATAPAATFDIIREARAKGPVTDTVLGVVAIDDAWGVMMFSVLLVIAQMFTEQHNSMMIVFSGIGGIFGSILLGVLLGFPMAYLTGRIRPGKLTLIEALGFVLLCSGLAGRYELSHIIACIAMGATVSNVAKHHERPFHAIEEIEQPFLIVFFLMAGFHFEVEKLWSIGLIGIIYVVMRSIGKIIGSYLGSVIAGGPVSIRKYTGLCLLPQAGVALGLSLVVAEHYPDTGSQILSIIVGTTIVFETLGPVVTRFTLNLAGEVPVDEEIVSDEGKKQHEKHESEELLDV